jgi:hypothetical protein
VEKPITKKVVLPVSSFGDVGGKIGDVEREGDVQEIQ